MYVELINIISVDSKSTYQYTIYHYFVLIFIYECIYILVCVCMCVCEYMNVNIVARYMCILIFQSATIFLCRKV